MGCKCILLGDKMKIHKLLLVGLFAIISYVTVLAIGEVKAATIDVETDRADALYKCGETTVFTVTIKDDQNQLINSGNLTVTLSNDGRNTISSHTIDLAITNPFSVSGTLAAPGFIRMAFNFKINDKNYYTRSVSGYDVLSITPGIFEPDDFDEFWTNSVAQLENLPLGLELDFIAEYSDTKQNSYQVSFANIDSTRIYGYLSIPIGTGPFPAHVLVPGAGPGYCSPVGLSWVSSWGKQGVIGLVMNVHLFSPFGSQEYIDAEFLKWYWSRSGAPRTV